MEKDPKQTCLHHDGSPTRVCEGFSEDLRGFGVFVLRLAGNRLLFWGRGRGGGGGGEEGGGVRGEEMQVGFPTSQSLESIWASLSLGEKRNP